MEIIELEQALQTCLAQARAIRDECKEQLRFNDGEDASDVCCAIRGALALVRAQCR